MLLDYLYTLCGFNSYKRILLLDFLGILSEEYFTSVRSEFEFNIVYYEDIEEFRFLYETIIKKNEEKYLIVVRSDNYIPYDIRLEFYCVNLSYNLLFPKLNSYALENSFIFDINYLYIAHENLYRTIDSELESKNFIHSDMYSKENIIDYTEYVKGEVEGLIVKGDYLSWREVSLLYSKLEYIKYKSNYKIDNSDMINKIEYSFKEFIINNYSNLSGLPINNGPIQLNRGLDYIFINSNKFALIVMDGMSVLDWLIIAEGLDGISYRFNSSFAIIPTITPISRQTLLSGNFPVEMERPFNLTYEKNMFFDKCKENGYREEEIKYDRGYNFDIDYRHKAIAVIINDIDDLVHSQKQGNLGMNNDIKLFSSTGKLNELIKKLFDVGFDVYITSDHGHRETKTIGNLRGIGVEVETKSKRAIILKDFGDYEKLINEFDLIEYPPYFLPKDYKYLICQHNESFGVKGDTVLSHGGISIEEVIVPFIKIEGVR